MKLLPDTLVSSQLCGRVLALVMSASALSGCAADSAAGRWQMKAFWELEFVRPELTRAVIAPPQADAEEAVYREQLKEIDDEQWREMRLRAASQLIKTEPLLGTALTGDMLRLGLVHPRGRHDVAGVRVIYTFSRYYPTALKISIPGFFAGLVTPIPGGALLGGFRRTKGYYKLEARLEDCRGQLLERTSVEVHGVGKAMAELSRKLRLMLRGKLDAIDASCIPSGLFFAGSYVR